MPEKVTFTEVAQNKLIDTACELHLSFEKREKIKELTEKLKKNPNAGKEAPTMPFIDYDYYIEDHIGDRLILTFGYDIDVIYGEQFVRIKFVRIGYKM